MSYIGAFSAVGNQQAAVDWEGQEDCKGGDSVSKRCESKCSHWSS